MTTVLTQDFVYAPGFFTPCEFAVRHNYLQANGNSPHTV